MKGEQYVDINAVETKVNVVETKVNVVETKVNSIKEGIASEYNASSIKDNNLKESSYFGSLFSKTIIINTLKYIAKEPKADNKIIIGTFDKNNSTLTVNSIISIPDAIVGENTISDLNIKILPNQVLYILGNDAYVSDNPFNTFEGVITNILNTEKINSTQIGESCKVFQVLSNSKVIQVIGTLIEPITKEKIEYIISESVKTAIPNYLYGKVLSVTGDSEAAGHAIKKQDTYGNLIANRNKMTINNYAIGGRKLITGTETSLVDTYTEIAKNSDYILVQIGYNDVFDEQVNDNSEDTTTFKGAFNVLIKGLQSNYPKAKIGFIEPYYFGNISLKPRAAWIKERCEFYHIQCIDGTVKSGLKYSCKEQADYFIDIVHLTVLGHERMSYIYENFLRGL